MTAYRYAGFDVRYYPDIVIPGEGSLVAHPGDERELEAAPDSRWIEVEPEVKPLRTGGLVVTAKPNADLVTVGE